MNQWRAWRDNKRHLCFQRDRFCLPVVPVMVFLSVFHLYKSRRSRQTQLGYKKCSGRPRSPANRPTLDWRDSNGQRACPTTSSPSCSSVAIWEKKILHKYKQGTIKPAQGHKRQLLTQNRDHRPVKPKGRSRRKTGNINVASAAALVLTLFERWSLRVYRPAADRRL